jgi:hypothetical protein
MEHGFAVFHLASPCKIHANGASLSIVCIVVPGKGDPLTESIIYVKTMIASLRVVEER